MTEFAQHETAIEQAVERLARQMHYFYNERAEEENLKATSRTATWLQLSEAIKASYRHVARRLIEAK